MRFSIGDKVRIIGPKDLKGEFAKFPAEWVPAFMDSLIGKIGIIVQSYIHIWGSESFIYYHLDIKDSDTDFVYYEKWLEPFSGFVQIDLNKYPHICNKCNSPAWINPVTNQTDCSNKDCK